jgi:hypothetical protein
MYVSFFSFKSVKNFFIRDSINIPDHPRSKRQGFYGVRKYGVRKYGVRKYGVRKYGVRKYGVRKYGVRKYGVRKYGVRKYGVRKEPETGLKGLHVLGISTCYIYQWL